MFMTYRLAILLPPLAKLSAVELEFVLTNYGTHRFSRRKAVGIHFAEFALVAVIIFAELFGLVAGWVYRPDLLGLLVGSTLALIISLVFCYVIYRVGTLLSIYWWLKSEQGEFVLRHTKVYEKWKSDRATSYDI